MAEKKAGTSHGDGYCIWNWTGEEWQYPPLNYGCDECADHPANGQPDQPSCYLVPCKGYGGHQTVHFYIPCGWTLCVHCLPHKKGRGKKKRQVKK